MTKQKGTVVSTTMDTAVTEAKSQDFDHAEQEQEVKLPTSDVSVCDSEAEATAAQAPNEEAVFLPVYNGVTVPVKKSDTARVTTLLQKGMKYESMAEDLERLHQLREVYNASTIRETIRLIASEKEQAQRDAYVQQYGKEAGEKVYELERALKNGSFAQADATADEAAIRAVETRLKTEFAQLQREYPMLTSIDDVPQAVTQSARENGITLLDAYNRHILREQQRAAMAAQTQVANQKATLGSLADSGSDAIDPVWEAFVRGAVRASAH